MRRPLKVFTLDDGFYQHVIATTSRAKALEAWQARQDLFHSGLARETHEPDLERAAKASPGKPLRRKSRTNGRWQPEG